MDTQQLTVGPRERLLEGLAASIREQGFWSTKVADIVRHARTSKRTFYEHFEDKEACFLMLVDVGGQLLFEKVQNAVDPSAPIEAQIDQAIDAYIESLTDDPAMTVSFARELPALGERGAEQRRVSFDRYADLCVRLVNTERNRGLGIAEVSMDTATLLVGGMNEMVVRAVERGEDLASLGPVAKHALKALLVG